MELVGGGQVTGVRRVELLLPACDLATEEPLGAAEVTETDRRRLDRVQRGERVHEAFGDRAGSLGAERFELGGAAVRRTGAPLHDVEVRAQHRGIGAQREGPRDRHVGVLERRHDAVLAGHVVGGREHVAERRPSDDPLLRAVGHDVGQVGPPAGDQGRPQLVARARDLGREPRAEDVEVEARGRFGGRHHGTTTASMSTTQAGLSPPSRSIVTRVATW